ncbi:sensor histidine kinase [Marinimicrobium sp. ARAG 43.8]|uniref:sensor histidine kinase n=1 Tax=Marinimicrobium sp. ARAG 43.8 TaxID=3418719 RepID=UPI003CF5D629
MLSRLPGIPTLKELRRPGIGQRLLLQIILFSSLITLIATGIQLYTDYNRDIGTLKTRLNDIEGSYLGSVSASLWNLDVLQLNLQLEGIHQLPDIQSVVVQENPENVSDPLHLQRGVIAERNVLTRQYPLVYHLASGPRQIGTLTVQASLAEVYARLQEKVIVILLSQGVKTFLVSMFILFIVYRMITTHLTHISNRVSHFEITQEQPPLALQRQPPHEPDELDQVVNAFNALTRNLRQAYEHMHEVNHALARDIVARRHAEEEVKRLNSVLEQRVLQRTAELEAANSELASFCYSVSHDLRAPLRRIEGFRRILHERYHEQVDEQGQHYLNRIAAGTYEMAEMIDSFLRLSRATQGELNVEIVDLSLKVRRLIAEHTEREPERPVTLDIRNEVRAPVDSHLFDMLLSNLVDNAWKYSSKAPETHLSFGFNEEDGERVYFIRDKGAGFDMQYAERLFAPFSRLHKNEEFDGVGIGLATVQRIITRHGGRIWAESSPGKGATFYFTLWERNTDREQGDYITG